MIPIVSIVGSSGSGKTTLMEKLIPELVRRGYRVATVKHDVHGFEIDHEGKDTWRHRRAGSACTIISSSTRLALVRDMDHDASLDEIREIYARDVDIVIAEGFKREPVPRVEVYRSATGAAPLFTSRGDLVAMVSDVPIETAAPFLGIEEIGALADIIENRFLK